MIIVIPTTTQADYPIFPKMDITLPFVRVREVLYYSFFGTRQQGLKARPRRMGDGILSYLHARPPCR
jgi:hypothetical protein